MKNLMFALAFSLISATSAQACCTVSDLEQAQEDVRKEGLRDTLKHIQRAGSEARQQEALHPSTDAQRCMAAAPEFRGNCVQEMSDAIARNNAARGLLPNHAKEVPLDGGPCPNCGAPK